MALFCRLMTELAELETLVPDWNALLRRSATDEPTLSPLWLLAWWHVFGPLDGRQLRVATLWRGDELEGLLPLVARRHWYRRTLPFRRLELLGSGEDEKDEICSEYIGALAARGAEEEVARALADALASTRFGAWDELVLPSMDGSSLLAPLMTGALNHAGLRAECSISGAAPFIPLPAQVSA